MRVDEFVISEPRRGKGDQCHERDVQNRFYEEVRCWIHEAKPGHADGSYEVGTVGLGYGT